ncbi:hypothetical protein EJB05_07899, partial [Eragrostis curvula]
MAIVSRSKRLAVPAALLLVTVMVFAAAAGVAAKADLEHATEAGHKDEESWTEWAKEKISEGLGFKHLDEEEAARKAGETAKSARETAQGAASEAGKKAGGAKEKAGEAATGASNKAGQAKDKATDTVKGTAGEASSKAGYAKEKAKEAGQAASDQ